MASATRLSMGDACFSFGKNPRVFASATLRRIHDQASLLERDAREPSWLNVNFAAVKNVRSEIDVTALEMVADNRRNPRERQRGLRDVTTAVFADPPTKL